MRVIKAATCNMNARESEKRRSKGGRGEGQTCGDEYLIMFECPTVAPAVKWIVVGLNAIKLSLSADIIQMNEIIQFSPITTTPRHNRLLAHNYSGIGHI